MSSSSTLVLGIDPSLKEIPSIYYKNNTVDCFTWGKDVISLCAPFIYGVKFQLAYFENYGLYGLKCLIKLIQFSKSQKLKIIMDGKRGDIGTTSAAYATAYLSPINDGKNNDFESDFLTVNPLMGEDCIQPFVDIAIQYKKGIFLLLDTSNKGASMILNEKISTHKTINDKLSDYIQVEHSKLKLSKNQLGPIGCVIGATTKSVSKWRKKLPNSIFLMPGLGAQGGSWDNIISGLTNNHDGVLIPISRGITSVNFTPLNKNHYLKQVKKNILSFKSTMTKQFESQS